MFNYILTITLSIIFCVNIAYANLKAGHPTPYQDELLKNPIQLDCGVTIREAQSSTLNYAHINSLCTHAYSNFFQFIEAKSLKINNSNSFEWNVSFLLEGTCYRCLNDGGYRFKDRFIKEEVIGYTSRNDHYAFVSTSQDSEFDVTFVHEMFHSMSMFYGVYDNHPGSWMKKTEADERLAVEFTEWLGYGR